MTQMFGTVLNMSLTACWAILAVLAARLALRRAPRRFSYALWSVVLFRLLCPVSFAWAFSPLKLTGAEAEAASGLTAVRYAPRPDAGLPATEFISSGGAFAPEAPAGAAAGAGAMEIAAAVWLAGCAALILWAAARYIRVLLALRGARRVEGRVYAAPGGMAFAAGLLRPRIYVPEGLCGRERDCVLAHERCHIRRGDQAVKPIAFAALSLHWFNPLVWLAWTLAMRDMETSCDEAAIAMLGEGSRADYAQALLDMASGGRQPLGASLSFGGGAKNRIKEVAKMKRPKKYVSVLAALLCAALIAGCAANPAAETAPASGTPLSRQAPEGRDPAWRAADAVLGAARPPEEMEIGYTTPEGGEASAVGEYSGLGVSGVPVSSFGGVIQGKRLDTYGYEACYLLDVAPDGYAPSGGLRGRPDGGAEAAVERVAIVLHDQYSGEDDVIYDAALDEFEALYGDISTGALRWIEDEGIEDEHDIDRAVWTVYGDGEAVSVPASRYNNEVWGALIPERGYTLSSEGGSWRLAAQEGGAYLEVTAMGAAEYGEWYAASFGDGKSLPVNGGIYERDGFWELCRWFEQSGSGRGIVEYIYCPAAEPAAGETLLRVYRSITMA